MGEYRMSLGNFEHQMSKQECMCGCGELTKGGKFCPGHDQKLRQKMEAAVGGLESLLVIVERHLGRSIRD